MRSALLLFALAACETRGVSSSLALKDECVAVVPGHEAAIHAQVKDAADEGANNVKVRWQVTPNDPKVSFANQTTSSTEAEVDGLKVVGVVSATLAVDESVKASSVYTVVVQTVDENALSATARIEVVEKDGQGCMSVDAGVPDAPTDTGTADGGIDSGM